VILRHTTIDGAIDTTGDLVVEGRVEGEVEVAGKVTIAAGGTVVANVKSRTAEIRGEVIGDIVCADAIRVCAGARVVGDLRAPDVEVDAGARVEGRIDLLPPAPLEPPVRRRRATMRTGPVRRPTSPPAQEAGSETRDPSEFAASPRQDEITGRRDRRAIPGLPRPTGRVKVPARGGRTTADLGTRPAPRAADARDAGDRAKE
jgi:cytoskeletal protein CcmA (bactofilin family)